MPYLSPTEIDRFRETGVLPLREAFPRAAALHIQERIWNELENASPLRRDDPATWRLAAHWRVSDIIAPAFAAIQSPRLTAAMSDLLGTAAWSYPRHWTHGLLASPPDPATTPWRITTAAGVRTAWHWDGKWTSPHDGLWFLPLYSQIGHRGGGTMLLAGSSRLLNRFYAGLSAKERQASQGHLRQRFLASHPYLRVLAGIDPSAEDRLDFLAPQRDVDGQELQVLEASGEPGDVWLTDPHVLHAKPVHHGPRPRFLSIRGVTLVPGSC